MSDKEVVKEYSNGEVTVVWKPGSCIHSTICWKKATGLPTVFQPSTKPWIKLEGATSQEIRNQVDKCPSGALSYRLNEEKPEVLVSNVVETLPNGPLLVYGNITVKHSGHEESKVSKVTAFCRCGASSNKPYCDGTHVKINFSD
ncbi:(4Fe-4S)-binding protein [Fluviicola taffensis]|uniref:Iron sulfur domain-containing, CDGSH-type n=1 Tax=Fluviicola taffensis (strain DSM 16823 / NCIMB 13979 / RW262) TaxID=755732 RepID=F2IAC1_FLUTR|nr:(4Fe-4S)-binding protein [Fluviicola taffensis]AEA42056.1 Iron sulfur domain-containing, CDGSH-type [Fluviicola taffensis DSM 16823]